MTLQHRFHNVGQQLGMDPVIASFYPYSELKHTWRYDGNQWEFKVSDYVDSASDDIIDSLAWHLLSRACSRKCPDGRDSAYLDFVRSKELWLEAGPRYLARAKTLSIDPRGRVRDLQTVFEYVNATYFSGGLTSPVLAWTDESPRRRLGYYFEQLNLLAVNRALDSDHVPRYVLEFVMYHEMLHHADREGRTQRTVRHTKAFREREMLFSAYSESQAWLRRIVSGTRRRSR